MLRLPKDRLWTLAIALLLVALPFFVFHRALTQGFAPIDDSYLVLVNLAARGPTLAHLRTAFTTFDPELYIPLTFVSYQINYLISGLSPWSYHALNLLLHGLNALLAFFIIRKITGAPKASFFAAALFAVHPLNTEAAVWIAARKDLLSTFFALAATLTYIGKSEGKVREGESLQARADGERALPLLLFLFALLSKVSVAPLPVALLLLDRMREENFRTSLKRTLPFFFLSFAFLIIAVFGKERVIGASHPLETILLIPRSTLFLLGKFFFPANLSPLYEITDPIAITNPAIFLPLMLFIAFFAFLAFLYFRTHTLTLTLALTLTFVLLLPSFLTFRKAGTVFLATDRYLYLPELGLLLFIALLIAAAAASLPRLPLLRSASAIAAGCLLALLIALSGRQTKYWNSALALFSHAHDVTPDSPAATIAYAKTYLQANDPAKAFAILKEGLQAGPDPRLNLAAGEVYARVGQVEDALAQFKDVLAKNPDDPDALFDLASVEEQTGRAADALTHYRRAAALDASDVPAWNGIGRLLFLQNDLPGAETAFRTALSWNANSADAHDGLADVLAREGKSEEADQHRKTAAEVLAPLQ